MSPPISLAIWLPLFAGTLGCAWLGSSNTPVRRRAAALWAGAVALGSLAVLLSHAGAVLGGQSFVQRTEWMPLLGLNLGFRLDGLALMFAGLIAGMGVLIVAYAAWYLSEDDPAGKFYAQLMLFMAAMLGIALSDNLLLLVVFWELTSVASFLLVGYWGRKADYGPAARAGARMALAVTGLGGLALLAGVLVLAQITGTYELSAMLALPGLAEQVASDPRYGLVLALVLLGCFTKSAQWPFHFWLPQAMAAPTPVSAYLHSATMVKAGLFLLLRLHPVIGGTPLFEAWVATTGLVTMVFAAFVAIFKHDLKALLAYSTVSQLGLIMFLIGLGSELAIVAALFHVLNHACFKAALFMSAGIVDHETHTRDLRRLGGLFAFMPLVGTLVVIAAAAMAGLPPLNGFISKELMLKASLEDGAHFGAWMPVLATLGGLFSAAYSLRLAHDTFFNGPPRDLPVAQPHEPPWGMKWPVLLLVVASIALGMAPMVIAGPLLAEAAVAVLALDKAPKLDLSLWHGFNLPLLMSGIAVVGGLLVYAALMRGRRLHRFEPRRLQAHALFDGAIAALTTACGWITSRLENGSLQRYVAWMIGSAVVLVAVAFWVAPAEGTATGARTLLPATPLAVVVWGLLVGTCAVLLRWHRMRFRAVVLVGVIGLVASLTFLSFSAPDLALTQLSVEVVSTVLLLMGLALLPPRTPAESSPARVARDGVLAGLCGLGVAALAWLVMTRDHDSIAWYFLENSIAKGGGANAVNVILVDFRGYDTWGEITVLGIAAVGVLALLDGFKVRRREADVQGRAWSFPTAPLMLQVVARLVLPMALMVSVYLYWRGHNLPGGGFIAGLVTASALVLQYMAFGQAKADELLRVQGGRRFVRWIALGLAVAAATGLGAFAFGFEYLTSHTRYVDFPLLGEIALASAAVFDLGVYITVVGSTMLTLSVLGNASKEDTMPPARAVGAA